MARNRPFGATNEPDTCLWCGKRLPEATEFIQHGNRSLCCRAEVEPYEDTVERAMGTRTVTRHRCTKCGKAPCEYKWETEDRKTGKREGYLGSNFCTLRCGWQFGQRMTELGSRLESK